MNISPFDSLPDELLVEVIAHAGDAGGTSVGRRWNNIAKSDVVYQRILEQVFGFVQTHPLSEQICELFPHITTFSKIPTEGIKKKELIQKIFSALRALGAQKPPQNYGLDSFKSMLLQIEWQGLCSFYESIKAKYGESIDFEPLSILSLEERVTILKEKLKNPKQMSVQQDIVLNLEKKRILLLTPEVLGPYNIVSINFADSGISRVPRYTFAIPSLKFLFFKNNPISTLPPEFKTLENLLSVTISGTDIRPDAEELRFLKACKKLQIVN